MTRAKAVWNVASLGLVTGLIGVIVALVWLPATTELPQPYTVPFVQGGSALRIAMIHDVLHERYSKHGTAWYAERERRSKKALEAAGDAVTDEHLRAMDDLAVALDRQGRPDEGTEVLRKKVALVERLHGPRPADGPLPSARARFDFMATQTLGPASLAWYRTCANLGTTLIHGSYVKARAGDAAAKERLREGLEWIRRSIAVNPGAHFGREVWQAGAVGWLLAACDDPSVLTKYDLIGQSLAPDALESEALLWNERPRWWWRSYRPNRELFEAWTEGTVAATQLPAALDVVWDYRAKSIRPVGAAVGWPGRAAAGLEGPAPFDEPVLAVMGMWTLGGGANPFSAMTLAGVCERIGQRRVAWSGYARALGLAERFGPDAAVKDALVAHCRARQAALEAAPDLADHAKLQSQHETELAFGLLFQELRAKFEEERIAAGADLDDPQFFVAFDRDFEEKYGSIASPVGDTDRAVVALDHGAPKLLDVASIVLFAFGLGAALGLLRR